ncbi:MAG: extracellular solute-binding protein [Clostridia bacterium]|nr:extracellular solute-binding protein [Clostridia bacterium]
MKRVLCLLASLLLMVTCGSLVAYADEAPAADVAGGTYAATANPNITAATTNGDTDYDSYIAANSGFAAAPGDSKIVIKGDSYASATKDANIAKVDEYDGRKNVLTWNNTPDESQKDEKYKIESVSGSVTYKFKVEQAGFYSIRLYYQGIKDRSTPIKLGIKLDDAYPFKGVDAVEFPRVWKDGGEIRSDGVGNQFTAEQVEVYTYTDAFVMDAGGFVSEPYEFALSAGEHTLTLEAIDQPFVLDRIEIVAPVSYKTYETVLNEYIAKGYKPYEGSEIVKIEGESATLKSTNSLIAKSDSSDPSVSPTSPYVSKINYIGSTNWQVPGDTITWEFTVPADGFYKLGLKFRQNGILNGSAYRKLYIDGEVPFLEAADIDFSYDSGWQYKEFGNNNGEKYLFYLTEGEHTLSMEVTIGSLAEHTRALQNVLYSAGNLYRKMIQITGESPDASRDYSLYEQIPQFEETLKKDMDELYRIASALETLYGKKGGTNATTIRSFAYTISNMLDNRFTSHQYINQYYNNYCSVNALMYEMMSLPLDIDYMVFAAEKTGIPGTDASFWADVKFSFQRLLSSFSSSYNSVSGDISSDKQITIWVNWGRDQVRVLNDLIQSSFTPNSGIGVNVKISNASYIQAILSGNGPDCSLHMARSEPVNLALRGAMIDLSKMDGYEETINNCFISPDAVVPYKFGDGVYALPDTQSFSMMYYRTDVFEELGIEPPETWDDFLYVSSIIMRNNYQVGMPYIQITSSTQTNAGVASLSIFPTLLMQRGQKLYKDGLDGLNLTNATAIETFEWWTNLYTEYKFPITYDFFNRFRTGVMPLGLVGYTYYAQLTLAAPEITGKWKMLELPGTVGEDGKINKLQAGSGTGCGILSCAKNPKYGWEFLKWWVSADTQLRYSNNCESILGVSGRVTTSNPEALAQMAWDKDSLNSLMKQWRNLREVEEVAGGYYTARMIDQAYWNVVNNGKNAKDMLIEWAANGDNEIIRKRKQYNLD